MKATNSLFVRLLLVAKSSRELDLQNIVGTHKFANHNASLMRSDGSLLPTTANSALIHELEGLVSEIASCEESVGMQSSPSPCVSPTSILIDSMAVVQEMVVMKGEIIYLLFDNYTVTNSMKDTTRHLRTAGRAQDN